uniref:Fe2OG dioxygenase domain-containing protein n=1 Tax=Kalanchoe fedtschenkoi TaxID=63787 RepID=A0A7N0V374_KALFE
MVVFITIRHKREDLEVYAENLNRVTVSLLEYLAMGLGLERGREFAEAFLDGHYYTRMSCYPPCPEPEKAIGIAKHCDISAITYLLECGDVPGLQVRKDDRWVFVQPVENSLVVNIGQILEIMSNGIYKAAEHRAVVDSLQERISISTFCYPDSNADIAPADELTGSENPALFKSVKFSEYLNTFYRRNIDTPFLDCFKL